MSTHDYSFQESDTLHHLRHFLPAQAPLKDFIHHNTLHAFQDLPFFEGITRASRIFGYKVSLSLREYRELYKKGRISEEAIALALERRNSNPDKTDWLQCLKEKNYNTSCEARVGSIRSGWEKYFHLDLDVLVHPILFRIICSYLDQGISIWNFPILDKGLLNSIRELEKNAFTSFFTSPRAKNLLMSRCKITDLLKIIVGDESLYEHYLYDQQFAHQGWSGMVAAVEDHPETLMDQKKVSLKDFIILELLLEIDALDQKFGEVWAPLGHLLKDVPPILFSPTPFSEYDQVLAIWQEAFEWTYYNKVLAAVHTKHLAQDTLIAPDFQALLCIDDREISLRDYLEQINSDCRTYATPGFFGVEFFFQPEHGRAYTKQCPAPVTPGYLIKEIESVRGQKKDIHLAKHSHGLIKGWMMAPTLGFWSALRLSLSIFKPTESPATALSSRHMDPKARLTIRKSDQFPDENGLQVGFTTEEMSQRVLALLRSIGLISNFGKLVYIIGHGASSANNPHYAAYNCGACSGRPGSVNARVFAAMANDPAVRKQLEQEGIVIPDGTSFLGALHDTTRDEIQFFDEELLTAELSTAHEKNKAVFRTVLDLNSKERARRFELINHKDRPERIHKKIIQRSVSLFEPRPELNHATNALCVVGRRALTHGVFLDRRAFANSYDYRIDPEGKILANIMRPLGPVCGGINLEYYFSRVDNQKLGAGSKLPHNVMGLFAVANGFDGDLRPGLPAQMIELHDPLRLLIIVEHEPEVVLATIKSSPAMYEWYINEWIHLIALRPSSGDFYVFRQGEFVRHALPLSEVPVTTNISKILETSRENLPVYLMNA